MPGISVVPYALLRKKQLGETRHAGHRPGSHGIRSGSEDFDRNFKVTASDKEFAARLIDPAMIQWLLSTGGQFGFMIQRSEPLVSCDQLPATSLVPRFDAAKSFTDHIPRLVWADYSTSQPTPRPRTLPVSLRRRPTGRRAPPDRDLHDHHDGHADRRPGGLLLNIAGGQPVLAALVPPSTSRRRATTGQQAACRPRAGADSAAEAFCRQRRLARPTGRTRVPLRRVRLACTRRRHPRRRSCGRPRAV